MLIQRFTVGLQSSFTSLTEVVFLNVIHPCANNNKKAEEFYQKNVLKIMVLQQHDHHHIGPQAVEVTLPGIRISIYDFCLDGAASRWVHTHIAAPLLFGNSHFPQVSLCERPRLRSVSEYGQAILVIYLGFHDIITA